MIDKISVIITAHDRREFLPLAIASVINQSLDRDLFEVVVVKNFSDQNIDKIINDYGFKSIIVSDNTNVGNDLYEGIVNTTGEVICFLDDDDLFQRDKLKVVYEKFATDDDLSFIKHNVVLIDENGNAIQGKRGLSINKDAKIQPSDFKRKVSFFHFVKADFNLTSMSVRRSCIRENYLQFLKDSLRYSTDTFFFSLALSSGKAIYLSSEKLSYYRLHDSSSHSGGIAEDSLIGKLIFWGKLFDSYNVFLNLFGAPSKPFIQNRIFAQMLAMKMLSKRLGKRYEVSLQKIFIYSIKERDVLLLYDLLQCL